MKYFLFLFFIPGLFSCSSAKKNNQSVATAVHTDSVKLLAFDKGKVIDNVKCKTDTGITYALYIPQKYSANKKCPIIFCFDPHGDGSLPIEKYKTLAEKYGYILAGSNHSKNGMTWAQHESGIKFFMNDVKSRLNIDNNRIYTCGFSGGSRVASSVAIYDGGINCVIGMGAGFPIIEKPFYNRFDYIGFAGKEDFNMNELVSLIASMDKSSIRHQLILFNGKHEWAPAEVVKNAFLWMEFNAMKDGLIFRNDTLINNFIASNDSALKHAEQDKNTDEELSCCKMRINFLYGLTDVSKYKRQADAISNSDEYKKSIAKNEALSKEEFTAQENYRNYLVSKDMEWWQEEIHKLNITAKDKLYPAKAQMNKRLLGYLSLAAYMNSEAAFKAKQPVYMEKFLKIYQAVDPENPEHAYLFADLFAMRHQNAQALASLKKAVQLGFKDTTRMNADTLFIPLKKSHDYRAIVSEIKSKSK